MNNSKEVGAKMGLGLCSWFIILWILFIGMKKTNARGSKPPKTKIELKIRTNNVTNNFIMTPRTASTHEQPNTLRIDRFTEEMKTDRHKEDDSYRNKSGKQNKRCEVKLSSAEQPRPFLKKKFEEDETGTHTPLIKRVSLNSQTGNKKKSYHSLMTSERLKIRRKNSSKLSNSQSAELNKGTLQKVIGIIIHDYREGKLKEKDLEKTLMELYDRRQHKKNVGKRTKKRDLGYVSFSNDFLKNSHSKHINSESLFRKAKKQKEDEIYESILQRDGIVNKIIIKGITTSLFLKDETQSSNVKETDRNQSKQSNYQINTSNSVREINEDMRQIQQLYSSANEGVRYSLEDEMAIKIQRAWRRFKTRQILKKIGSGRQKVSANYNILEDFTDEEQYQETKPMKLSTPMTAKQRQYAQLVNLVSLSLNQRDITKEQCLKNILSFLNVKQSFRAKENEAATDKGEVAQIQQLPQQQNLTDQSASQSSNQLTKKTRVKMLNNNCAEEDEKMEEIPSNDLNSFTNKYSSRQVNEHHQFYIDQAEQQPSDNDQLDDSLTFVHSQTSSHEVFKMINIQNIEEGLKGREQMLVLKKQREIEELTDKLFSNNITKEDYFVEKERIDSWFKTIHRELKQIRNSLLRSCSDAKKALQSDSYSLNTEKSQKMLKCLSDKYIKRQDWSISKLNTDNLKKSQNLEQSHKIQPQSLDEVFLPEQDDQQAENMPKQLHEFLIFNKKDILGEEWQGQGYEISPKMLRHPNLQLQQNGFNYDQIERIIQQEDERLQDGELGQIKNCSLLQSDKLISEIEAYNREEEVQEYQMSLINNMVNERSRRLKYLSSEDKEDIFEFLFLDLVLEMFTERYPGLGRVQRAAENYIVKAKRLKRIPKGIKTSLLACKDYLKTLANYVLKDSSNLKRLSTPMGPTASEMLCYMRDEAVETEEQQNPPWALVLPLQIFEEVGKLPQMELKLERYYDDEEREMSRLGFLKTALHINNKALFDSLNENLDRQRPYGVWGRPFPWKKRLSVDRTWSVQERQTKLIVGIEKTIESCSYMCGILVDKQDSLFGNHRVSEQYILQIREDRLSKMLANQLIDSEQRWIFYDDEEAEIEMELSSFITRKLLKEVVLELVAIRMRS